MNRFRRRTEGAVPLLLTVLLVSTVCIALLGSPVVVEQTPADGGSLPLDGVVQITFSEPMDRSSVEAAWRITPAVAGQFVWADDRTVSFVPDPRWEPNASYRVTLDPSARSAEQATMIEAASFVFRILGSLDVVQAIPAAGSEEIAVTSDLFLMFNRPVIPLLSLADPRMQDLPHPLALDPAVPGTGAWLNTSVYVFTPEQPLQGGTLYTATVLEGLTAVGGETLSRSVSWQFTTERPRVVSTSPAAEQTRVSIRPTLRITFNMPVCVDSVASQFSLKKSLLLGEWLSAPVSGTWTAEGHAVFFTPDDDLAMDQAYVFTLDAGVTAIAGGEGTQTPLRVRFETAPLPKLLRISPMDGEIDVSPYTSLVLYFNTPIDPETVLENVSVRPEPSGGLSGYFRAWDHAYVIGFDCGPSQAYEVTIGPGIADPYGHRIDRTTRVRFWTRALNPTAWLHVPDSIGTGSIYQPASLFIAHRNLESVSLTLYRLSLDEYFRAVDRGYDYSPPKQAAIRAWTVAVSGELNRVAYTPVTLAPDGACLEPGVYLVDMRSPGFSWNRWQHRHMVVYSPVNLTMKTSSRETLVWACDLSTGAPLPGLILRAYDGYGNPVEVSITDRNGIAEFSGTDVHGWRGVTVVGSSPFVLAHSRWTRGISVWDFGFSSESATGQRLFLDTDRPIYRPGHTVYFRGVLRTEQDVAYTLPPAEQVRVTVRDPSWQIVLESTLPVDRFGTFTGEVLLSDDARIGSYRIEITATGLRQSKTFSVAAYRPPEFELSVAPHHAQIVAGEDVRADVQVQYYFGAPVTQQPVSWKLYEEAFHFTVPHLGRYSFSDRDDPWACWICWWIQPTPPAPVLSGTLVTDGAGQAVVDLPAATLQDIFEESFPGSRKLTVEATAQGADNQVISGRGQVVVHAASFYAGLAVRGSIGRAGTRVDVDAVTVNWFGDPVPDQPLEYRIIHRQWVNVLEEDEAGGGEWIWSVEDTVVETGQITTDPHGRGQFSFVPVTGGVHKIVLGGVDDQGNETRSSVFLWASGPDTVSWRRTNDDAITLIADQSLYYVGDTASILIPSPYSEPHYALVTVERDGVMAREVHRFETNSPIIEIPIEEAHLPNVYVSVVLFQGLEAALRAQATGHPVAESKVGYALLTVSRNPRELRIELHPSESRPGPGSQITYDLRVHDAEGRPVQAALSFDLVDAAVLALRPRVPNAIMDAFYSPRGLGVATASGLTVSLNRLVAEQRDAYAEPEPHGLGETTAGAEPPMAAPMDEKLDGSPVMQRSAAEQLPEGVTLREQFLDTAFWDGTVITDDDGYGQVSLRLPDNLTTWVARAVAVSADTLVGESTTTLLVTKPLLIRPATPRFLVVGDRVRLLANVSNQTDEDLAAEVLLAQTGLRLEDSPRQHVVVPAQGEVPVVWWGVVQDVSVADLAFSVTSHELSDAARPRLTTGPDGTLRVFQYTAPDTVGTAGQLDQAGSRTEIVVLQPTVDPSRSALSVQLESSLAAAMQQGLRYLEHFEYECTEQVVSRFLPNVLTHRAMSDLGIARPEWEDRLPDLVAEGVEKLVTRQNPDGGWGWWDQSDSSPLISAYAVYGLLHAERAGFAVPRTTIDHGLDFLSQALVPSGDLRSFRVADRQAWLVYVLAEAKRTEISGPSAQELFEQRIHLSHYARAWLALALDQSDGDRHAIDTLVSDLYSAAILSATGAHWEETQRYRGSMNTDTRSTAIILSALVRLDPDQPLLPNIVRWLMTARRAGIWETTQQTAWALIALTDWMAATQELQASYTFDATMNGVPLLQGHAREAAESPLREVLRADELRTDEGNRLTISRSEGTGRLYYTAHLTSHVLASEVQAMERGIIVQRQYVPTSCVPGEACEPIDAVSVGEEILVRLTIIAPHDLYYVVLEDPFPAGCEPVDPSLATTSLSAPSPQFSRTADPGRGWFSWWWWRWYTQSEFRDEKVVLFADTLPAGAYTFEYTLRAVTVGEFGVLPAVAHEFYFPEVFGRSDGRSLLISPADD